MQEWDAICQPLVGKVIKIQQDEWGDIIVIDQRHERLLSFDNHYEQSRIDKNRPTMLVHDYTRAMLLGLALIQPKHITLLGLGGGCLVRALHSLLDEVKIEIVELRQAVVDVAQSYFDLPETTQISITVADAKEYSIAQKSASTDIIFADMYQAYEMSPLQIQEEFIYQCHRILSTDGWLVINYHDLPKAESPLISCLNALFEEVLVCPVPEDGNFILFAGKCKLGNPLNSYFKRIAPLQLKAKTRFDLLFRRLLRLSDY
ncbi:MAG: spermidine synthase [Pseudohongiellaceae bacterium]|jgi:spermidine synthase